MISPWVAGPGRRGFRVRLWSTESRVRDGGWTHCEALHTGPSARRKVPRPRSGMQKTSLNQRLTDGPGGAGTTRKSVRGGAEAGLRAGRTGRSCGCEVEAVEQRVAQVARVDDLVEPHAVGHAVGTADLGFVERGLRALVGVRRLSAATGRHGAEGCAREGERERLPVEGIHSHRRAAEAERLAKGHVELRRGQSALRGEQACGRPQRARALGGGARHHAGVVGQEDHGQAEASDDLEEARALLAGLAVEGAGPLARIVGDDRHRLAAEPRETRHQGVAEGGLHLEEAVCVGEQRDRLAHLVRAPVVGGHEIEHRVEAAPTGVVAFASGCGLPGIAREVPEVAAGPGDRGPVVLRHVVGDTADLHVHVRAAEGLLVGPVHRSRPRRGADRPRRARRTSTSPRSPSTAPRGRCVPRPGRAPGRRSARCPRGPPGPAGRCRCGRGP